MLNVFKSGGDWKSLCGKKYTVKTINEDDVDQYLSTKKWFKTLELALESKKTTDEKKVDKDDNKG